MLADENQGEAAALDRLRQEPLRSDARGFAQQWLKVQKQSGTAAAVDEIQRRLKTAKAKRFVRLETYILHYVFKASFCGGPILGFFLIWKYGSRLGRPQPSEQ
jgi:hypothetical protein